MKGALSADVSHTPQLLEPEYNEGWSWRLWSELQAIARQHDQQQSSTAAAANTEPVQQTDQPITSNKAAKADTSDSGNTSTGALIIV